MSGYIVNDTEPGLTGVCKSNGTGKPLTDADTITVNIRKPDGTVLAKTPAITGTNPFTNTAFDQDTDPGRWLVEWTTGDLNQQSNYRVQVKVVWNTGRVQHFGYADFPVDVELA